MAYHFESTGDNSPHPRVPMFWNVTGRIHQLFPNETVFTYNNSVIEDPKTGEIGIDTNDPIPNQEELNLGTNGPIGLLRVLLSTPEIDGYIVDLRYTDKLPPRSLGFTGYLSGPIAEQNEQCKTVPALGAIFLDPSTSLLYFPCQKGKGEVLEPFAQSLMKFVDAEREKRGIEVVGGAQSATQVEISSEDAPREAQ